jgi:hypothetical protein
MSVCSMLVRWSAEQQTLQIKDVIKGVTARAPESPPWLCQGGALGLKVGSYDSNL